METKPNHNLKSLVGQQFNFLRVLARAEKANKKKSAYWTCLCVCGNETDVRTDHLKAGKIKSCGCKVAELVSKTPRKPMDMRGVYNCMKERVLTPCTPSYKHYKRHGIRICAGWLADGDRGFQSFNADLAHLRLPGTSLDRINSLAGYTCGHCEECKQNDWTANVRWSTPREQMHNRRDNVMVMHHGEERAVAELAYEAGMSPRIACQRVKAGWDIDRALTTPVATQSRAFVTYKGETKRLAEWCAELHLRYDIVYTRIKALNWSVEEAFETPMPVTANDDTDAEWEEEMQQLIALNQ